MSELVAHLGTLLTVWAHPDDETYLVGGLSAALTDAGHRVVCVTATRGEAGGNAADLAETRTAELEAALAVLGVEEHHWLDYPDGGCDRVDVEAAASRIRAILDEVRPDTVVTFGPDGFTGHPDHQAVSHWVDRALELSAVGADARLLHPVRREHPVDPGLDNDYGVFELGLPRTCRDDEIDVLLPLDGAVLDRKVEALLLQESQTAGLVAAVGCPGSGRGSPPRRSPRRSTWDESRLETPRGWASGFGARCVTSDGYPVSGYSSLVTPTAGTAARLPSPSGGRARARRPRLPAGSSPGPAACPTRRTRRTPPGTPGRRAARRRPRPGSSTRRSGSAARW